MIYELEQILKKEIVKSRIKTRADLDCFKRQIAKKYKIAIPKNSELLKIYHEILVKKREGQTLHNWKGCPSTSLEVILRKRPVRSLSGIVNVSVLSKPYACPGKCIFCPSQKNIPKSYLAGEPAVQRALLNKFNPYKQVAMRLNALQITGHPVDKIDLRIIGGTWSYYPKNYQKWFISECFRACNEFSSKFKVQNSKLKFKVQSLEISQKQNEKAKCRIIGIAVETRPDFITPQEIQWMRTLGITKVELGAQSVYNDVLGKNQRGHNVEQTILATQLLKNAGFKVSYQIMPNLYGSSFKKDIIMFRELFTNPNFMPDYLKIYPLALVKNTELYKLYQQGKFKPYSQKQLTKLLIEIKKQIPYFCRVERIIRDIPPKDIVEGGSKVLNLREVIAKEMKKQGPICRCVRCREVGSNYNSKEKVYLFRENYKANNGKEIFLSFENKTRAKLYALLRLRLSNQAIVRDLHTYGQMTELPHPERGKFYRARVVAISPQHKGLGKKLLAKAENIAKQNGYSKISVISGIGARPYYRKLGYKLQNTYMVKNLNFELRNAKK